MGKRYVSIWFPYLATDWFKRHQPSLRTVPFVLSVPAHGRLLVHAACKLANQEGIFEGMSIADARVAAPSLQVMEEKPALVPKLLRHLAEYCIQFTPVVAIDLPNGLILDATGCAHLWGGEQLYLKNIVSKLESLGFHPKAALAGTIGTAWALARFGNNECVIETGKQLNAIINLPPACLRIEQATEERLQKLGLRKISDFIAMPRTAIRRRFGQLILKRLDQALGVEQELVEPVVPVPPYHERIVSTEPIVTRTGIDIGLEQLLQMICTRLAKESKGLRKAVFKCFRIDGKIITLEIGTNRPTYNEKHLFRLFEIKLDTIEPAPGIEVFTIDALETGDVTPLQEKLWETNTTPGISLLLDCIAEKFGHDKIHRYLPDEHHWPERSIKISKSLHEECTVEWRTDKSRPIQLLPRPEPILVTAPIPDYPPMLFRYHEKIFKIAKADGPERIEQEWWLQNGEHRDYYTVETEEGCRYWLFRQGHYTGDKRQQWFLHGFFV